jgi:bifunctional non-homologous end joining protein LigD
MSLIKDPVALMRLVEVDSTSQLDSALIRSGLGPQDIIVETKFNGWLTQAAGGRLYSRRGKDLTDKFPHIARLIAPFKKEHLIGELVYFDPKGMMVEPAVTEVAGTKDPREAVRKLRSMPGQFDYVVFDVLAVDGEDISKAPTSARREILDQCLCNTGITLSNPQPLALLGSVYDQGVGAGGDGVVVKNLQAPYHWRPLSESEARPAGTWWKLKPSSTDDFVVIGTRRGKKGSLLAVLAQYHNGRPVEVSDVNNFSAQTEAEVLERIKTGPFVMEVEYTSRFPDPPGSLQHPRFVRFRDDRDPESALLPEKYAPSSGELGVALKGFRNYWLKPAGEVLSFGSEIPHDIYAREGGYENADDAIRNGWVRAFEYRDQLGFEFFDIQDESALDRIAAFLEDYLAKEGSFTAALDFQSPRRGWFSIHSSDLGDMSVREAIREGSRRPSGF